MQKMCEEVSSLLDISVDARNSVGVELPAWASFIGVYIPDYTVAAVTRLMISRDNGSNYVYVIDQADGAPVELAASGTDPGFVDISDWVRGFLGGPHADQNQTKRTKIRLVHYGADETTSDKTYYVVFRA